MRSPEPSASISFAGSSPWSRGDSANRSLFAARIASGSNRFFYASHAGVLYLASEVKRCSLRACRRAGIRNPFTIRRPGHFAGSDPVPGSIRFRRDIICWPLGAECRSQVLGLRLCDRGGTGAAAAVRAGVHRGIWRCPGRRGCLRMRADVPVGCYLSGGTRPCAVLGLAARHAREPIQAFTLTFDHAAYDEVPSPRRWRKKAGRCFTRSRSTNRPADHFATLSGMRRLWSRTGTASRSICSAAPFATPDSRWSIRARVGRDPRWLCPFRRDMVLYQHRGAGSCGSAAIARGTE